MSRLWIVAPSLNLFAQTDFYYDPAVNHYCAVLFLNQTHSWLVLPWVLLSRLSGIDCRVEALPELALVVGEVVDPLRQLNSNSSVSISHI